MQRNYSFDERCDKERIEAKLCMYLVTPGMCFIVYNTILFLFLSASFVTIGVRAGGARGAAAPPNFGQLRFFGQREKIWAKPVFKDVFMFI